MVTIKDVHEAAKILRSDGIECIYKVSSLIGWDRAMPMLIFFLHQQFSPDNCFPEHPEVTKKVDEFLEKEGLLNFIYYSPSSGRGVVFGKDSQPTHVLSLSEPDSELQSAAGIHLGMWLQSSSTDFKTIPAGNHPFEKARAVMRVEYKAALDELCKDLPNDES